MSSDCYSFYYGFIDSFTIEFYKTFVPILLEPLMATCNYIMETGKLLPSWECANMIVIPKSGKDTTSPKSCRPISLLNVNLKIFTSTLANHLNRFTGEYMTQDQIGFIPERDLEDSTTKYFTLYSIAKKPNWLYLLI